VRKPKSTTRRIVSNALGSGFSMSRKWYRAMSPPFCVALPRAAGQPLVSPFGALDLSVWLCQRLSRLPPGRKRAAFRFEASCGW